MMPVQPELLQLIVLIRWIAIDYLAPFRERRPAKRVPASWAEASQQGAKSGVERGNAVQKRDHSLIWRVSDTDASGKRALDYPSDS
jgi:hypothetical protein